MDKVAQRLHDHEIVLHPTPEAIDLLVERGFDPDMGARPLRREIQQAIEDPLSDALLSGEIEDGNVILITVNDQKEIVVKPEVKEPTQPQVA